MYLFEYYYANYIPFYEFHINDPQESQNISLKQVIPSSNMSASSIAYTLY